MIDEREPNGEVILKQRFEFGALGDPCTVLIHCHRIEWEPWGTAGDGSMGTCRDRDGTTLAFIYPSPK